MIFLPPPNAPLPNAPLPNAPPPNGTPLTNAEVQRVAAGLQSAPGPPVPSGLSNLFLRIDRKGDNETQAALGDMALPQSLEQQLGAAFARESLTLTRTSVEDRWNATLKRFYTKVSGPGASFALLHLPGWFLDDPSTIGSLEQSIYKILDHSGRIVSQQRSTYPISGWINMLETYSSKGTVTWRFVDWNNIARALAGEATIFEVFQIPRRAGPAAQAASGGLSLRLRPDDENSLIEILEAELALQGSLFGNLMNSAGVPQGLQNKINQGLKPDVTASAIHFVKVLAAANRFGKNSPKSGDTYLGWVLCELLDQVGNPTDETLVRMIMEYDLIGNEAVVEKIRRRGGDAG
jgi:hypothetical protein